MDQNSAAAAFQNQEELSDREKQILTFCEQQQDKLKRALNKTYKEGKAIGKIDETQKRLKKLMPAKLAFATIIRAIKKRDYLILTSDTVPEIDQIKPVVPEIMQYADEIKKMYAFDESEENRGYILKNERDSVKYSDDLMISNE